VVHRCRGNHTLKFHYTNRHCNHNTYLLQDAIATITANVIIATGISGMANVTFVNLPKPSASRYMFYYSLKPLAENSIMEAYIVRREVENLLKLAEERGLDVRECKAFYDRGLKYIEQSK